ncbi:hypothetical protein VDG1235_2727 [Verrucomicrobiia bacterium DG1235]|nr:hypothetical protein VDG1235_2727 [Verrucomicrobiae bacterium DG1235]
MGCGRIWDLRVGGFGCLLAAVLTPVPIMIRSLALAVFVVSSFSTCLSGQSDALIDSARTLIARENLSLYRGWLKYLVFDVEVVSKRMDVDEVAANEKRERLRGWVEKIAEDPDVIRTLRGVQEWAYESAADGSGQPFMINIPQDYEAARAMPVSLYMHGYTGTHSAHYSGDPDLRGIIELSVLGRSRGGGYVGLSGADVLDVLDYVESVWNVDEDRVHLLGGSMGGHGTFRFGSRYPHRFASGRPTCGFAGAKPYGNFITLPIYATHSQDDPTVPFINAKGPLDRLRELGGQVVFDWTTGLGHAAWNYAEGNSRSDLWFREQVRPDSRTVRNLNYTAFDGEAMRSWWAEIEEWGDEPKPAKFVLTANPNNTLYATLDNIAQLKLRIVESPFDMGEELRVSVNGGPIVRLEAPLPEFVYLKVGDEKLVLSGEAGESDVRRHTPGGPNLLYNGEPLLIVYGTQGSDAENAAMLEAARVASRSGNAAWLVPNGEKESDGLDHNQNLYGNLRIKSDVDLTEEDRESCHLVLIGTAEQNLVVAEIADELPVRFEGSEIRFSDGEAYAAEGLGVGLVHYNPDTPQNLIYWVASEDPALYRAGSPIPEQMAAQFGFYESPAPGFDCLVSAVDEMTVVAARSFRSDWSWREREEGSAVVGSEVGTYGELTVLAANAIREELDTDFGFFAQYPNPGSRPFVGGVTRLEDFVSTFFYEPLGVITLSGADLLVLDEKLRSRGNGLTPAPESSVVDGERDYTLGLSQVNNWALVRLSGETPTRYRLTDIQLRDVLDKAFSEIE